MSFDYIIIGAGLAGITAAEEIANVLNKKVLLIDKNNHIGGNCYDYINEYGTIIHKYGPHVIHTDNQRVYEYLSLFTLWNIYNHKVLYKSNDKLVPIPFNLISIDKTLPEDSEKIKNSLLERYEVNSTVKIKELINSDDENLNKLGNTIYNIFYKDLNKLYRFDNEDKEEIMDKMMPFHVSYDCRYYKEYYQVIPAQGYTKMFENMLSNHNITIMLEKDYHEIIKVDWQTNEIYYEGELFKGQLIYTGMIDEFFDYKYGKLPYKSLILVNEDLNERFFQDNASIHYLDDYHFRKISEIKYFTGQQTFNTTIQFEYPVTYDINNEEQNIPYYPIDSKENRKIYEKYKDFSKKFENITFLGRLSKYENTQMDECVQDVLSYTESLIK